MIQINSQLRDRQRDPVQLQEQGAVDHGERRRRRGLPTVRKPSGGKTRKGKKQANQYHSNCISNYFFSRMLTLI